MSESSPRPSASASLPGTVAALCSAGLVQVQTQVRLVRAPGDAAVPRQWERSAAELVAAPPSGPPGWDPVQVLGGPGTGKTALLVDVGVSRLRTPGTDPESVLVLVGSKQAARTVREQITAQLTGSTVTTVREPLVRTVHSYAFAVLRLQAARNGNPPPRLISGPEQDAVFRELLRGDVADGARRWPLSLRPALGMAGFATELRNLLLRAAERGAGPEDLVRLGRARARPEWVAAGRFGQQYEQSMLLRAAVGMAAPQASAPAVDAAELVSAAVDALGSDRRLLADERNRVRHLLIDDAQHLDAGAAHLVRLLGAGAAEVVLAGDPDQAVFGFRGADPGFLTDLSRAQHRRVLLRTTHRCAPAVAAAVGSISARLAGTGPQRAPTSATAGPPGSVSVQVLATPAHEARAVADTLRRAHLLDGIDYADMAVVVRSTQRSLPALRRAMLAAGVPLSVPGAELALAQQHAVAGFLLLLRALSADPADEEVFSSEMALALLASPVGRADPVALRRLQRGLRRVELAAGGQRGSAELIRELVLTPTSGGTEQSDPLDAATATATATELAPLHRVQQVLAASRAPLHAGHGLEEVLWAAWSASGLERRWVAQADRGGSAGAQANRDLDAAVALFDAAARYVDRLPAASVTGFVDYLSEQEIAGDAAADRAPPGDAVSVLTAHSAAGRQWRLVAVAGVQEGHWPALGSRGGVLGAAQLADELSGGPGPELADVMSRTAPKLAEERRLFLVACSRARERLLVTAVRSGAGDGDLLPSRFLAELGPVSAAADEEVADDREQLTDAGPQRSLVLGELVADLRSVVCDPDAATPRRHLAAAQLARLAAARVPGAHPAQWYGLAAPSTDAALWADEAGPVPVSPSSVEQLGNCPLRWLLERHGGQDGAATAALTGTLVHTLVQSIAEHTPPDAVDAALARAWSSIDQPAPWFADHELERTRAMLDTFRSWWQTSRGDLTEVAAEVDVDLPVTGEVDGRSITASVRGRIDRLERDASGRLVVVDVKTGRTPVTAAAAAGHAQLAAYQLAVAGGGVVGQEDQATAGGARLVYVAQPHTRDGATQRVQPAPTPETLQQWRTQVLTAAARTRGPGFTAAVHDGCPHCPVQAACPAQAAGRQVTAS